MKSTRMVRSSLIWLVLTAAATAAWGQAVLLELKYEKGETRQYKTAMDIEMGGDLVPGGRKIQEDRTVTWEIKKVNDDGSAEVLVTNTDVTYKENGEVMPDSAQDGLSITGLPLDVPLLFTFTKTGNIRDIQPTKELRSTQKAKAESFFDTLKNQSTVWPEKPVKPGHTWEDTVTVSTDISEQLTLDISVDMTYTFEGMETRKGLSCAKIKTVGSGSGVLGEGRGSVEMENLSVTFIDLERGRIVETSEESHITFTIMTERGEGKLLQTYKVTLSLIP